MFKRWPVLPGSFILEDSGSGLTVVDNEGNPSITSNTPEYEFTSIDLNSGKVTLTNGTILYLESIDYNTGETEISYQGELETPNPILVNTNLSGSQLIFESPLSILDDVDGTTTSYGDLFQQSGDLIINSGDNPNMLQTFDLSFKSTTTISELEVLVEVEAGEFTTSTNPTVDYFNITSQSWEHTMTDERGNNYIETIKDFTPRKKQYIYSNYGSVNQVVLMITK